MLIGRGYPNNGYLSGRVDEVRISDKPRSSSWIATAYSNIKLQTDFHHAGEIETYPGVIFSSLNSAETPCLININSVFMLHARVQTGIIASVNIAWGDGQINSYSPCIMNISEEEFSHIFLVRSNFTVTAVVTAASGYAATNSITVSTLPYRLYNPQYICFSNDSKGCLVKWNIASSANVQHYNVYRGNDLHARIENPALCEYLDESVIFGDRHAYWLEAVYAAGSVFSATNISQPHSVYYREVVLGTGGGSLDTLIAGLYAPQDVITGNCIISMTVLSNRHASFYESGKPVYHQIELSSSDISGKIKGGLVLKFRIPATNGVLSFRPVDAPGYTVGSHKDKLFCAVWDGKTWTSLSTAVYENRHGNNFSFLELEASVNRLGIYGVMYNPQAAAEEKVIVKNRLFIPALPNPALSSVQISFPNPEKEQVKIQICNMYGRLIKEESFSDWISFWSWNGHNKNKTVTAAGLYIISIQIGGRHAEVYNIHAYLVK